MIPMNKIRIVGLLFPLSLLFVECSDMGDVGMSGTDTFLAPLTDWTLTCEDVAEQQGDDYMLSSSAGGYDIYEYNGSEDVVIAYHFNAKGNLDASLVMLGDNYTNQKRLERLLPKFWAVGTKDGQSVYTNRDKGLAAMLLNGVGHNGKEYLAVAFAPYVQSTEDDPDLDYVDLGLSVLWAKRNVGAKSEEESGGYYSWAETSEKSEYWRETYSYCNNYANKYIFVYTNSLAEISGTKYDVAMALMGDEWRMPTRDEALELIYSCTWEKNVVNGVEGTTATGPSGKSIFFPYAGHKKQNKGVQKASLLWTADSPAKSDEDAYRINISGTPSLDLEWKAWGLPVRAVYVQ